MNRFLRAAFGGAHLTENGAVSNPSSGDPVLDYFAKCGTYRGRLRAEVDADYARMWAASPRLTLAVLFYTRLVTRKITGRHATEQVQKGQGARDEFRKGLSWLARNRPEVLKANLRLVPSVGRWSDLWHDELIEVLPQAEVFALIRDGLADPADRELIAKYLPQAKSRSKTHTEARRRRNRWIVDFRAEMGWTAAAYRRFKASPEHQGHALQRALCKRDFGAIEFGRIPGRALSSLVGSRGRDGKTTLERRGMTERYLKWLSERTVAPFNGYPYELYRSASKYPRSEAEAMTFDRQFDGLVARAKADRGGITENVWCALDTSGSMSATVAGPVRAVDVCLGLGLYFSALNEGAFADSVVMFDASSRLLRLKGRFCERVDQLSREPIAWGHTNFQSVIDLICQVRRTRPEIPVEDFPRTLLVVSDMQFDPAGANVDTNYQAATAKLRSVGLPCIRIVWWYVTGRGKDFPSTISDEGVTMVGGFDGAILELLSKRQAELTQPVEGRTPNPYEQMVLALDQEILRELTV